MRNTHTPDFSSVQKKSSLCGSLLLNHVNTIKPEMKHVTLPLASLIPFVLKRSNDFRSLDSVKSRVVCSLLP